MGIGVVGRRHTDGRAAGELAGVTSNLLRRIHPDPDEFEIGAPPDRFDGDRANIAGRPDDNTNRFHR
jgi:hypothetical protein